MTKWTEQLYVDSYVMAELPPRLLYIAQDTDWGIESKTLDDDFNLVDWKCRARHFENVQLELEDRLAAARRQRAGL